MPPGVNMIFGIELFRNWVYLNSGNYKKFSEMAQIIGFRLKIDGCLRVEVLLGAAKAFNGNASFRTSDTKFE